jgi:hypothetical protein
MDPHSPIPLQELFHPDRHRKRFRFVWSVVAATSLFLPVSLRQSLAASPQAAPTDVLVARNRTEPVVAVDPRNPSVVVAAANTDYDSPVNGTFPLGAYSSLNGGKSFSAQPLPIVAPYSTAADPSVAVARDGTVFYSYLGEVPAYCQGGKGAIVVIHSVDHGRSFRPAVLADSSPADDKPAMAVESGPRDHVFLVWDRLYSHSTAVWFTRSSDGGQTFVAPRALYVSRTDNYGPVPVVGPNGHVYVFWSNFPDRPQRSSTPTRILMRASVDDGRHFGPTQTAVASYEAAPQITEPGSLRNMTMAAAVADPRGALWLAWARPTARFPGGRVTEDIEIKRSIDAGKTWTAPAVVNDAGNGDRFMPALALWPNRSLGIVFYDRRRGPGLLDMEAARVWFDHGIQVSRNVRLNAHDAPVADIYYIAPGSTCFSPGRFFGDYVGVAAQPHGKLCAIWADTQLRLANETDIWFTRVTIAQRPRALAARSARR